MMPMQILLGPGDLFDGIDVTMCRTLVTVQVTYGNKVEQLFR